MTQRHAMRRGVKPRPSDKDIRALERLLKRAAPLAADPFADGLPFVLAAEKAGKAILPVAYQVPGNPFSRLMALAGTFLTLATADRYAVAAQIGEAVGQCRAALEAHAQDSAAGPRRVTGEARMPAFRRDIDG